MTTETAPTIGERLLQLLDKLELPAVHFCLRSIADLESVVSLAPERIASAIVCGASGSPRGLGPVLDRTLWIQGDTGEGAKRVMRILSAMAANIHPLPGYLDVAWSNTAADRSAEVRNAMLSFLAAADRRSATKPASIPSEGEVAGIRYRAAGRGTPVLLLPMQLSASQWDPVLPALQEQHCTVVLGGPRLIPVSHLEDRAAGDYGRMALDLLALLRPQPGESLIEAGCGAGSLLRRIAQRWPRTQVTGLDVNSFLLGEARELVKAEGLSAQIALRDGSAETMPFADDHFDIGFSSTMMEEGDARRMLAELVRVTKPGGRVAVIVRAIDLPRWTNLPLPDSLRAKLTLPSGGVADGGCADAGLLRRFHQAGLSQVQGGPAWAWMQPGSRYWEITIATLLAGLTPAEVATWEAALGRARAEGLPVSYAQPYYCATGVK